MIDGAGGFDLVRGGAVQQHRVATVGAHDVVYQSPDIPFRARGWSGPLAGPDQCEALGESVIRPAQQVEGDHARPCLPGDGALDSAAEEAVTGGLAALDRIGVAMEGTPLAVLAAQDGRGPQRVALGRRAADRSGGVLDRHDVREVSAHAGRENLPPGRLEARVPGGYPVEGGLSLGQSG